MGKVQHTVTGCVPVDRSALEAYLALITTNKNVNDAEQARVEAEESRVEVESARVEAESARVLAENARVEAESARVLAENARVEAETARETQAGSDHTRAEGDHEVAVGDHTRAGEDHTASETATDRANAAAAAAEHMVDIKQGPKGDQGNTGSSVDYPYELVNNVTTDDATKGLSAAQGVVLDGKISQLGQEVYKALHDNVIYAYSYDGTDLKIAYNDGNGLEYIYWFRKCMANELFTFWIVGYRSVERNEPSVENITINSQEITRFLTTISDNIGPVLFSNKWVGGAHLYEESVKTARTDNVSVYIDDNELPVNSSGICSKISIKVVNTIFNPNVAPSEGEEILSSPLLTEMVSYYIVKNNIEVAVLHKYFDNLVGSLNSYMGMQSVLIPTHILTPNGLYSDWTVTDGTMSFNKEDYPLFNRFIAKNSAGYLSAYLKSAFIGDHKFVLDANRIYHFSSNKNYHHLIDNTVITQVNNLSYQWKGTYTFFKDALIDSNGVTAYMGIIDDTDVIYVSVSSAKDSLIVPVPTSMTGKNIHVIENNGFTNENGSNKIEVGSAGIILKSTGAASFIAVFEDSVQDRNIDTNMLKSKDWSISGNVVYDSNDIPQSYNITWADGTAGTVVMSSFNEDVFEYSTITATYQSKTIVYNLTYDVNGYITNETISIQ